MNDQKRSINCYGGSGGAGSNRRSRAEGALLLYGSAAIGRLIRDGVSGRCDGKRFRKGISEHSLISEGVPQTILYDDAKLGRRF